MTKQHRTDCSCIQCQEAFRETQRESDSRDVGQTITNPQIALQPMKTEYFTFGQAHIHKVNGKIFDKDVVVKITAKEPREHMYDLFGEKWAMNYTDCPDMQWFPRGIIEM